MSMLHCSFAVLLMASLVSTQKPESAPQKPQDAYQALMKRFAESGISLDMKQKTVTVDCEMGRPDQALEFLLVHHKGKDHESLLVTKAKASILNAALLAIGLEKGKNARVVQKDPLPTLEEVKAGAQIADIFAPEGRPMYMTVKWKALVKGEGDEPDTLVPREASISDLVFNGLTEKAVVDETWIYLGGKMGALYRGEAPVFIGDYQGNLVSIVYKQPQSHLVTMSHELATNEQAWWFTKICPAPGTLMKLTFHRNKPKLVAEREARVKKAASLKKGSVKPAPDKQTPDKPAPAEPTAGKQTKGKQGTGPKK